MKLGKIATFYLVLISTCLAQPLQSVQPPKAKAVSVALLLEYVRAIDILEKGLQDKWDAERYLSEYDKLSDLGTENEHLTTARLLVRNKIAVLTRPHAIWDERPPVNAEAHRLLDECKQNRDLLLGVRQP